MNTQTQFNFENKPRRKTAKDVILEVLEKSPVKLAVHEMGIKKYSENNIATRLSELAREGKVIGIYRKGRQYKEWKKIK
jgi:acetoacetate decarboxylase